MKPIASSAAPVPDVPAWFARACAERGIVDPTARAFGRQLMAGDPLADELTAALAAQPPGHGRVLFDQALTRGVASIRRPPAALRAFFESAEAVPSWVD